VRLAAFSLCLPALVFLSFQLHSVRLDESAIEVVEAGNPAAADVERAERLLDRAEKRNPTSEPEFRKAQLFTFSGQPERAVELLKEITADEPEHLSAWILLVRASGDAGDEQLAVQARARIAELNPRAARPAQ
jgi:predicted Zn-dependent protease